jgi:hypothetical protein
MVSPLGKRMMNTSTDENGVNGADSRRHQEKSSTPGRRFLELPPNLVALADEVVE